MIKTNLELTQLAEQLTVGLWERYLTPYEGAENRAKLAALYEKAASLRDAVENYTTHATR